MFTGIVEELGRVEACDRRGDGLRLEIAADVVLADVCDGASIAVNGCCLTVVEHGPGRWAADVAAESLSRTNLGSLSVGDEVNLERPVRLGDRLGGHIVQGHVDATGSVRTRTRLEDGSSEVWFDAPDSILRYVVEKGSIAVDGVSLTVADLDDRGFAVAAIPHTLAVTTLGRRALGTEVNLEADMIAKYVERFVAPRT